MDPHLVQIWPQIWVQNMVPNMGPKIEPTMVPNVDRVQNMAPNIDPDMGPNILCEPCKNHQDMVIPIGSSKYVEPVFLVTLLELMGSQQNGAGGPLPPSWKLEPDFDLKNAWKHSRSLR